MSYGTKEDCITPPTILQPSLRAAARSGVSAPFRIAFEPPLQDPQHLLVSGRSVVVLVGR